MKTEINTLAIFCGEKDLEAVGTILSKMGYGACKAWLKLPRAEYNYLLPQKRNFILCQSSYSDRTYITAEDFIQKYGTVVKVDSKQTKPFSLVTSDGVAVSDQRQSINNNKMKTEINTLAIFCGEKDFEPVSQILKVMGYYPPEVFHWNYTNLCPQKDGSVIQMHASFDRTYITAEGFIKKYGTVEKNDHVNHPPHYEGSSNTYEAIKVIEAWELDFCLGNTVKYIARSGKKDTDKTVQDLEKAKWYLERKISQLKLIQTR